MPTNVGPNTKGEENLVFGYDLGDVANSYKGEPTENLGDAFPDSSLPSPYIWTYEYSASISSSPIGNHPFSNRKWIKLTKTSSTNGRVLFIGGSRTSGSRYTVSSYVYIDDSNNTSLAYGSDNSGYSIETSEKAYDFSKIGTVQRIHGTWDQQQNASSVYGLRGGSGNPTGSVIYMTGLQLEEKPNPTQLTETTRSVSGSLIDLTGNSTIDLSNVSFDSNAQMTFDGTDDYVSLGDNSTWDFGQNGTLEMVVRPTNSTGNDRLWCIDNNSSNLDAYLSSTGYNVYMHGGVVGTTTPLTQNQYNHLVVVYNGGTIQIYINGAAGTMTGTTTGYNITNPSANNSNLYLGCYRDLGYNLYGDINLFKVYNRALTASEVQSNYNAIKGRFNI